MIGIHLKDFFTRYNPRHYLASYNIRECYSIGDDNYGGDKHDELGG